MSRSFFTGMLIGAIFLILTFFFFWNQYTLQSFVLQTSSESEEIQKAIWEPTCVSDPEIHFFMYHYIRDIDPKDNAATKDLSVSPKNFRQHMQTVRKLADENKITLMTGKTFLQSLQTECFPGENIWVFTADDGWIDMKTSLAPIADEYHVPFFLGIITGSMGKSGFITPDDVVVLSKNPLFTITAHSITHGDHSQFSEEVLRSEMCGSKYALETLIKMPVQTYVYPSGRINTNFGKQVEKDCGYIATWSTGFGVDYDRVRPSHSELNRIRIHGDTPASFFDRFVAKEPEKILK